MDFFDDEDNVTQYEAMAEGYDGAALIEILGRYVPAGARVLELGMGPGKDLELLRAAGFAATGSDRSEVFLRRYRERGGQAPTLRLDVCTLKTALRFEAIYSNKVLHHISRAQLRESLARQRERLEPGGVLLHALWCGQGEERHHGLLFTKYDEQSLAAALPPGLGVVEQARYAEMEEGDSLWVVLRREDQGR